MKPRKQAESIKIIQNADQAIAMMHKVGSWMQDTGMKPSKWWQPKNLNKDFLFKYAKPSEFYVVTMDDKPAAAVVLQTSENSQSWLSVDKDKTQNALYIHWLCVDQPFAGTGLPKKIIDFAKALTKSNNTRLLRVDTNAEEIKLRKIYEDLEFKLVAVEKEDYRKTAFYQMEL